MDFVGLDFSTTINGLWKKNPVIFFSECVFRFVIMSPGTLGYGGSIRLLSFSLKLGLPSRPKLFNFNSYPPKTMEKLSKTRMKNPKTIKM